MTAPVPIVTLLTDYGAGSDLVGVCHGVIARIAPHVRVIDMSHDIPPYGLVGGAVVLRNAIPYFPAGVHVAVVDPGVGGSRRAVAVRCRDRRMLVGPDNGILSLAVERSGGAVEALDIGQSPLRLDPVAATFHGRDIFCPAAAHLAAGAPFASAGESADPADLVRIGLPPAEVRPGRIAAPVTGRDRFGNVQLNLTRDDLGQAGFAPGASVLVRSPTTNHRATVARTFADVPSGELAVFEDSFGAVAIGRSHGSASELLQAAWPDSIEIEATGTA